MRKSTLHRGACRAVAHVLIVALVLSSVPAPAAAASSVKPAALGMEEAALTLPSQNVNVNRTRPDVDPVPQTPVFSEPPQDEEFFRARVFAEPFIPFGETSVEENRAFAQAILAYHGGNDNENVTPFGLFLNSYPNSAWRVSLLTNLGLHYHRTGYFRRAKSTLAEAWGLAQEADDRQQRAIADRALGELFDLHGKFGEVDKLEELIEQSKGRDLHGDAVEKASNARNAIYVLRQQHHEAIASAAMAVDRFLSQGNRGHKQHPEIARFHATPEGASLDDVLQLTQRVGLKMEMALRPSGWNDVVTPSIVHLREGHFAALLREENGRFLLSDPILGGDEVWLTPEALLEEASGYFLVPAGRTPQGWSKPRAAAVQNVRGKCVAAFQLPGITGTDGPPPRCGGNGNGDGGPCPGMAIYSFNTFLASLQITDTPVGHSPPIGPAVAFTVSYDHREAYQPAVFTFSNIGPRWSFAWLSYVEDDPNNLSGPVRAFRRGGGSEDYSGLVGDSYPPDLLTRAVVVRTSSSPITYERRLPDGSVEVFAQSDGALSPRRVFLTAVRDAQGNSLTITYDSQLRISAVIDALDQVTTFTYGLQSDPLKITKVTDPLGRSATLEYSATGALARITDVIGIVSEMEYGSTDFIRALTTPYGTTSFSYASPYAEGTVYYNDRWLEATDPLGGKERIEFRWTTSALPATDPANTVPTGFVNNADLHKWNSYHWDKRAMALHPGDFTKARTWHWLWSAPMVMTAVAHSEKQALEGRVWYGQVGESFANGAGRDGRPAKVGRVLDDGTSQISRYEYNARGKVIRATDPVGRTTIYNYDTNDIDLLEVRQVNGQNTELVWSATYNGQHLPLTVTDTAGQTTTYTYNAAGQLLAETTPPRAGITENRTTTYVYDTNSYLQGVTGPATGATTSYTYDAYGRVRTVTDSDNYTVTYDYDALDRLTKITYPDATFEETTYNRLDAEKRRDRRGRWTQTFYDALRRPVAVRDAAGQTTQYQYGGSGCSSCGSGGDRLTKLVDPNGNAISWEYDVQGRLTREVRADASDVEVTYETTSSRVKQIRDRKQQLIDIQYFLDNNWKQVSYSNTTQPTPTVSFTYDPVYNRLATMTDGTGTTSYSYYPVTLPSLGAGRLQSVDGPLANDVISYSYDELGSVVGRSVNGVGLSLSYDALGRLTGETNALGSFSYGYDGVSGRVTTAGYPSGQSSTYSYFGSGGDHRLQQILNQRPGGATLSAFQFTYDLNGLITSWTQQTDSNPAKVYGFGRDGVDRLLAATLQSTDPTPAILKRHRYLYDPASNRTAEQIDDAAVAATHNNLNALTALQPGGALSFRGTVNEPATVGVQSKPATVDSSNAFQAPAQVGAGTTNVVVAATDPSGNTRTNTYQVSLSGSSSTLSYDANGNLTSDGVRTFEWDGVNRLTAVNQGTHRSEFTYDGWGQRVRIVDKDNAVVTSDRRFLWCGSALCEERDATGAVMTRRFFGQGMEEGGAAFFYAIDHLGTVRELTDATGAVRARYEYDPYGRATKLSGDKDSVFTFAGLVNHTPSGLLLATYRAYDPNLGRWISQDPIGLAGGPNMYAYVGASPIDATDPEGLLAGPALGLWLAALGVTPGGVAVAVAVTAVVAVSVALAPPAAPPTTSPPSGMPPAPGNPEGRTDGGAGGRVAWPAPPTSTPTTTLPTSPSGPPLPPPNKPDCPEPPDDDCAKEWAAARDQCTELMSSPDYHRGLQGPRWYNFDQCVRGHVSERCGGSMVDQGPGKNPMTGGRGGRGGRGKGGKRK